MSRIVLVEDDEAVAELLCLRLQVAGHDVEVARDGLSGLRLARTGTPDVILLDLMLPGIDGLEVCRRLRLSGGVPVIMLSASDSTLCRELALDVGADEYICKPFSMEVLLQRIAVVMGGMRSTSSPQSLFASEGGGF
jgi:DNA-binding response OmpR family regulator